MMGWIESRGGAFFDAVVGDFANGLDGTLLRNARNSRLYNAVGNHRLLRLMERQRRPNQDLTRAGDVLLCGIEDCLRVALDAARVEHAGDFALCIDEVGYADRTHILPTPE